MAFNMQPTHVIFLTTQLFLNRTHIYMFGFSLCSDNCLEYHVNVHYALFIPLSIQTYCVCACERPLKWFIEIRRNWLYFVRYTSNIFFIAFYRIFNLNVAKYFTYFPSINVFRYNKCLYVLTSATVSLHETITHFSKYHSTQVVYGPKSDWKCHVLFRKYIYYVSVSHASYWGNIK